ncbi:hypothetical protein Sps_02229 [Shewanella psychrophila]|uniref:Uncharacterized protein n=1 Tax=Shewanella psychrophila TaxID=225848 RepID=A0A1S6HPE3_9GAMM|nr:hypothetical protein [Shewanella psychrophila]AQS37387.1 hypothetical protein Sps_02229 [Shewanella psychrophila]
MKTVPQIKTARCLLTAFSSGLFTVVPIEGEIDWENVNLGEESRQRRSDLEKQQTIEALRRGAEFKREVLRQEVLLKG